MISGLDSLATVRTARRKTYHQHVTFVTCTRTPHSPCTVLSARPGPLPVQKYRSTQATARPGRRAWPVINGLGSTPGRNPSQEEPPPPLASLLASSTSASPLPGAGRGRASDRYAVAFGARRGGGSRAPFLDLCSGCSRAEAAAASRIRR